MTQKIAMSSNDHMLSCPDGNSSSWLAAGFELVCVGGGMLGWRNSYLAWTLCLSELAETQQLGWSQFHHLQCHLPGSLLCAWLCSPQDLLVWWFGCTHFPQGVRNVADQFFLESEALGHSVFSLKLSEIIYRKGKPGQTGNLRRLLKISSSLVCTLENVSAWLSATTQQLCPVWWLLNWGMSRGSLCLACHAMRSSEGLLKLPACLS